MTEVVQFVDTLSCAAALMSEARLKILDQLAEPDSASGIARRIDIPRQQVNYHLRELEKAGLVSFVEERRKGNCIERVMRASARSYVISPEVLGALGDTPEQQADRFSIAWLVGLAARAIRDLAAIRRRSDETGKRAATLALDTEIRFASPAERAAFAEELTDAFARLTTKYHSQTGRKFRIIAGAYPALQEK